MLFEQDTINKYLWCSEFYIWEKFTEIDYKYDYQETQSIINEILKNNKELNEYQPKKSSMLNASSLLTDDTKIKVHYNEPLETHNYWRRIPKY